MGGANPTPFGFLLSTFDVTFADVVFDVTGFPEDFELCNANKSLFTIITP